MGDEYIKREDALDIVAHNCVNGEITLNRYDKIIDGIYEIPSANVAPVVRCKDCRHAVDYYHEGDCYCSNPKWGLNYFGGSWEFYCADAERRNNE